MVVCEEVQQGDGEAHVQNLLARELAELYDRARCWDCRLIECGEEHLHRLDQGMNMMGPPLENLSTLSEISLSMNSNG